MLAGNQSAQWARFHLWIRRADAPGGVYAVRFQVNDGKGILRVARPGVLIDPPARTTAEEGTLTESQLRASRFLHVADGGRRREGHAMSRLEPQRLGMLPAGEWVELVEYMDGTNRYLVLPTGLAGAGTAAILDDEPTSPQQMLADLRERIRVADGADRRPVRARADTAWSTPTEEGHLAGFIVETPATVEPDEQPTELPECVRDDAADLSEPSTNPMTKGESEPAEPSTSEDSPSLDHPTAFAHPTALVRHLRRKIRSDEARILELEALLALRAGTPPE